MSPVKRVTPKKENPSIATTKRGSNARQKNVRQNANVKSRAIVSTDPSSSDEDEGHKKNKDKILSPVAKEIPTNFGVERSVILSPLSTRNSPRRKPPISNKVTATSSDEDEDEDEEEEDEEEKLMVNIASLTPETRGFNSSATLTMVTRVIIYRLNGDALNLCRLSFIQMN